jgi:hypothetical protein
MLGLRFVMNQVAESHGGRVLGCRGEAAVLQRVSLRSDRRHASLARTISDLRLGRMSDRPVKTERSFGLLKASVSRRWNRPLGFCRDLLLRRTSATVSHVMASKMQLHRVVWAKLAKKTGGAPSRRPTTAALGQRLSLRRVRPTPTFVDHVTHAGRGRQW